MKKFLLLNLVLLVLSMLAVSNTFGQRETATGVSIEKDLDLMRRDLRAEKKKLIALNVTLTEEEATRFWPIYDQYALDMAKHNDDFYAVIKDYAANQKTLTDVQAIGMIKRWNDILIELAQTRQKYIPMVEKVIPGRKAALFFQIDRRLYALMDIQVASEIPLVIQ